MPQSLYRYMLANTCNSSLKIHIIEINLKQTKVQDHFQGLPEQRGKIECLTISMQKLKTLKESSMVL